MNLLERLRQGSPVVLDGATGTQLEARGVDVRNPLWGSVALLTDRGRALTEAVHRDYVAAGAELVIANSHNVSLAHVAEYLAAVDPAPPSLPHALAARPGPAAEALTWWLNREAVARAQAAGAWVAGCLASPDRPYATEASLTAEDVAQRLHLQYAALRAASPDLIVFEMLTTLADLQGVAKLVADFEGGPPVAVGVVAGDDRMLGGVAWADAGPLIARTGAAVAFIQCTTFERVEAALVGLAPHVGPTPLGAYANDGGYDADLQAWSGQRTSPEDFGRAARRWAELGARIIGGCCGTGPAHVAAIRQAFESAPGDRAR